MFHALGCVRRRWLGPLLALAFLAVGARADDQEVIAVAPARTDAALAPVGLGFDRWLATRLQDAGVSVSALEAAPDLHGLLAAASQHGLTLALVPQLSAQDGEATVRLLLFVPDSGAMLSGARAKAPITQLGDAAVDAFRRLVPELGGRAGEMTPPLLDDLASTSEALEALRRGDLPAAYRAVQGKLSPTAMALREEIIAKGHDSSTPPIARARLLTVLGDSLSAWTIIGRSARAGLEHPHPDPQLMVAAGEVLIAQGALAQASRYFSRALEVAPDDADAHAGHAHVLALQKDYDGARAEIARAERLDAHDPQLAEAAARLDPDPARSAAQWIEAGRRSAYWLDARRSRYQIDKAQSIDPDVAPQAHAALGALEEQVGRPAKARAAYQRAIKGGVRTPTVLTALGRVEHRMGDAKSAESSLRQALALDPKHPAALRELGAVYVEAGRNAEALPLLRKAHEIDGSDHRTRLTFARALRATGDADEALAVLAGERPDASFEELAETASIQVDRGDLEGARKSLRRAAELDPGDAAIHDRLAQVLDKLNDSAAATAERQLAAALDPNLGQGKEPQHTIASVLSLDELVMSFARQLPQPERRSIASLGVREPDDWRSRLLHLIRPRSPDLESIDKEIQAAIDARFKRANLPPDALDTLSLHVDRLYDFDNGASLNAETIATVNQVLGIDGSFVTRLITDESGEARAQCESGTFAIEMRLLVGRDKDSASVLSNHDCLDGGFEAHGRWNPMALAIYAALALLIAWPVIRGWGQIVVKIRLPDRTKGFFSIHITRRADAVKREVVDANTGREKSIGKRFDFLKRYQRHMAGDKTVFRLIPARKLPYTVTVSGPLMDARGEEIIGHFLEEQRVNVKRRRASELLFDFRPKEVAVEVTVKEDGRPASGARVSVMGDPSSLRYARDGVAYLYLGLGSYTILVGSHDAAAQFEIDVSSLQSAIPLVVDMSRTDGMVFQGCADAVESYLQSDLSSAARALESAGNPHAAHLLRAELYRQQGRTDEAARELEAAGELGGAAALRAGDSDLEGGAALYEQAGEIDRAADAYRDAGAWTEAARLYEQVYDYGNALECWREAGDSEREMAVLEKLGEFMDAALIARERGDQDRVIANLQHIEPRHAQYGDACRIIAEIASENGDHDLAVAKFEEALSSTGIENASIETLESYAAVLERAGRKREALSAYEAIRRQDMKRPDIASRIESLKRELSGGPDETQRAETTPSRAPSSESRYEILEEIGRGGMGVVYKARDRRLGRVVALKRLPENLRDHPAAVELFEREARAAASLNHVNIVTVFDAGEEDGSYFITMELLEGRTLNAILEARGHVSPGDAMRLGIQICAGLHYAHDRHIVHRDIKAANLFFTRDQVVKIMDFGIAKSLQEVRRKATVIGGTPFYMAPEQASGDSVDHRADLYALGVTLFQLVTGHLPFEEGDVSYQHRHEQPPDPRELNLNVPADLARLILELMAKSPEERPPNAAAVGVRLSELLGRQTS